MLKHHRFPVTTCTDQYDIASLSASIKVSKSRQRSIFYVITPNPVRKSRRGCAYVITDKDVLVNEDRMLMGHATYPLAIAKGSVV